MMYIYGAAAVVALYCLYLFHDSAYDAGVNAERTACQAEVIQELEDKNAKIVELQVKNQSLRKANNENAVKVAKNLSGRIKEIENERDQARGLIDSTIAAFKLQLVQGKDQDGLGGDGGKRVVGSPAECNGEAGGELPREIKESIADAQGEFEKDLESIGADADRNTEQLNSAQQQLLDDRRKVGPDRLEIK